MYTSNARTSTLQALATRPKAIFQAAHEDFTVEKYGYKRLVIEDICWKGSCWLVGALPL